MGYIITMRHRVGNANSSMGSLKFFIYSLTFLMAIWLIFVVSQEEAVLQINEPEYQISKSSRNVRKLSPEEDNGEIVVLLWDVPEESKRTWAGFMETPVYKEPNYVGHNVYKVYIYPM